MLHHILLDEAWIISFLDHDTSEQNNLGYDRDHFAFLYGRSPGGKSLYEQGFHEPGPAEHTSGPALSS